MKLTKKRYNQRFCKFKILKKKHILKHSISVLRFFICYFYAICFFLHINCFSCGPKPKFFVHLYICISTTGFAFKFVFFSYMKRLSMMTNELLEQNCPSYQVPNLFCSINHVYNMSRVTSGQGHAPETFAN